MRFLISFILIMLLGYWLDGKFVNFIASLFPASMAEWMRLIRFGLWIIVGIYSFFFWFMASFVIGIVAQTK